MLPMNFVKSCTKRGAFGTSNFHLWTF